MSRISLVSIFNLCFNEFLSLVFSLQTDVGEGKAQKLVRFFVDVAEANVENKDLVLKSLLPG